MRSICIVVQNYYDTDPRVRREAEALVQAGFAVDVLGLRAASQSHQSYQLNGVQVHTLKVSKLRGGKWNYLLEYFLFFILAGLWLGIRTLKQRYDIVQVCTLPDFLVFATIIPKIFGSKIVLDMHEVMPEFYISKYQVLEKHWMIRLLKWQEKASIWFANHILTINEPIRQVLVSRGLNPNKVTIIMNSADEALFQNSRIAQSSTSDPSFVLMYHGTITRIYGLDIAVRALGKVKDLLPDAELWIIGDGPEKDELIGLTQQLSLKDRVKFIGVMPQQAIPSYLAKCTVGILPTRKDVFLDLSFSNKLPEYIIMKKPVIASRLKAISHYFTDDALAFFEPENDDDLARKIIELHDNIELRQSLVKQAEREYAPIKWEFMKGQYIKLMKDLSETTPTPNR